MFTLEIRNEIALRVQQGYLLANTLINESKPFVGWISKDAFPYIRKWCIEYVFWKESNKDLISSRNSPNKIKNCNHLELIIDNKILTINHLQKYEILPRKAKFRHNLTLEYNLFNDLDNITINKMNYFQIIHSGYNKVEKIFIVCLNEHNQEIKKVEIEVEHHEEANSITIADEIAFPLKKEVEEHLAGSQ
ncbi:MAG TPA: hypothetical protein ENI76_01530 [Ignavibacteria bacterium]|nr:hypothetical protein [Ignavibacteria bacterium]